MMRARALLLVLCMSAGLAPTAGLAAPQPEITRTSSFSYYGPGDGALNGLLKSETVEPDNAVLYPNLCVVTTYTYDTFGNKTGSTTENCPSATGLALFDKRTSSVSFDGAGRFPVTVTNALGDSETHGYDARFGVQTHLVGPNNLPTSWAVDDFGRKIKEVRADGTSTLTWYCVFGDGLDHTSNTEHPEGSCPAPLEAPVGAVSLVQSIPYGANLIKMGPFVRVYSDRLGRTVRTVTEAFDGTHQPNTHNGSNGALIATDVVYNAVGAVRLQTQPYFLATGSSVIGVSAGVGTTETTYDALGRPLTVESTGQSKQTFFYKGLETTQTNDLDQSRVEEKNINGQVLLITDASGAQLIHQYDALGNLVKTKDALQNTIEIAYDLRGRKISMKDPDAGLVTYQYNALGELVRQQNAKQLAVGQETVLKYDKLGRLVERQEPDAYTSFWYYDKYQADGTGASTCNKGTGKLCETRTSLGLNRKIQYDHLGRPVASTTTLTPGPIVMTASLSYDDNGRLASQTYPTGVQVGYGYTARGFLEKVTLLTSATLNPLPAEPPAPNTPPVQILTTPTALNAGSVLWQAMEVNAWGRAERQWYANGITSRAGFEPGTGRLAALTATSASASGGPDVMNHSYAWDSLGNLQQRTDHIGLVQGNVSTGAVQDTFVYGDKLNRLTQYQVSAPNIASGIRTVAMHYNALGMLLDKSDVGNYHYGPQGAGAVRPHALLKVTAVEGITTFEHDERGNLKSADAGRYRSISYFNAFNLPDSATGLQGPKGPNQSEGLPKYTWTYDENHGRISETRVNAEGTRNTYFLHPDNQGGLGFEREVAPGGAVSNRHYLSAGGQVFAVLVTTGALQSTPLTTVVAAVKLEFWHKDHLGSLSVTTDHAGTVTQRYSYDPFGKRRFVSGEYDALGSLVVDWSPNVNSGTDRGFTGHEHLDDVGVIHMNGRIFDPTLGVFLQADPFIQAMGNLQNFNRYGYCLNNPGSCTDPSGFLSIYLKNPVRGAKYFDPLGNYIATKIAHDKYGYVIGQIAISVVSLYCGPFAPLCNAGGQAAWATFAGYSDKDAFRIGVIAGVTSYAYQQVGLAGRSGGWSDFQYIVAHAAVGCASSVASGGDCQSGAIAAGFGKFAALNGPDWLSKPNGWDQRIAGVAFEAVVGGTGSVLGGGKFANGAISGAFGYLFNALGSEIVRRLYRPYAGAQGHHLTPEAVMRKLDSLGLVADDVVEHAGRNTIGRGHVSRGLDGDPHHGYSDMHRASDNAIEAHAFDFIERNGITKDTPMSVKQYYEMVGEQRRIPIIRDFWNSIHQFVDLMSHRGVRPNLPGVARGGRGWSE